MKFRTGDRVCVPDGREGVVFRVDYDTVHLTLSDGELCHVDSPQLTHAVPPVWQTSLAEARRVYSAIETAAEAAHDRFYEIVVETSDLGYRFADERTKRAWREVAIEVLKAVGEQS